LAGDGDARLFSQPMSREEWMNGTAAAILAVDIQRQAEFFHEAIHDRQTETATAGVAFLPSPAALERLEDRLLFRFGNARSSVDNANRQEAAAVLRTPGSVALDAAAGSMATRLDQQVGQV